MLRRTASSFIFRSEEDQQQSGPLEDLNNGRWPVLVTRYLTDLISHNSLLASDDIFNWTRLALECPKYNNNNNNNNNYYYYYYKGKGKGHPITGYEGPDVE